MFQGGPGLLMHLVGVSFGRSCCSSSSGRLLQQMFFDAQGSIPKLFPGPLVICCEVLEAAEQLLHHVGLPSLTQNKRCRAGVPGLRLSGGYLCQCARQHHLLPHHISNSNSLTSQSNFDERPKLVLTRNTVDRQDSNA